ncbi:MAG: hypothetical protein OES32_15640 [Acidobacteriota bacterium]|nr:hypothetical protein [Acidobacteriota bacterium]
MNWSKAILAGVVAGIVVNVSDFVMHGLIMGETYTKYPTVFSQEQASPLYFAAISVCIGITAAILFAKTRGSWGAGWQGGATYGFFLGLVAFFPNFYDSLVIADFPYYLSWCWGGITLIGAVIGGAVLGAIYKS